jgi:hypothetical protein
LHVNVTGKSEVGIDQISLDIEHINETIHVDLKYTEYHDCGGKKECSKVWSILLDKPFYWQFTGRAKDTKGKLGISDLVVVTVSSITTTTTSTTTTTTTSTTTTTTPTTITTTSTTTIPTTTLPGEWKWEPLSLLNALIRFLASLFWVK